MARRRLLSVLLPLVAATAAAGVPAASAAATKLIHAGTLLALPGQAPERERTLVIVDDRISEVRDGYADPADFDGEVEVVDLKDYFVLPGLMDMHVHLQGELGPENDSETLRLSPQQMQMRSVMYA
ncbi:MAG TPA: hypothetical protein VJ883_10920, partial [Woeseiaceae bacterium]|nr:hypothetical protein [Woeseiaceae bacterium]